MSEEQRITVQKIGWTVPVSTEVLYWNGAITREQAIEMGWTPPPPPTRWQRWRWALRDWWHAHKPHFHLGPCDQEDYS